MTLGNVKATRVVIVLIIIRLGHDRVDRYGLQVSVSGGTVEIFQAIDVRGLLSSVPSPVRALAPCRARTALYAPKPDLLTLRQG